MRASIAEYLRAIGVLELAPLTSPFGSSSAMPMAMTITPVTRPLSDAARQPDRSEPDRRQARSRTIRPPSSG